MSTAEPQEAKELSLISKVELRIALAETEDKLQSLLATYLCPLLLKLASPHQSVKEKVINICQHVNTRTRSNPIRLPVAELLQQFKKNRNPTIRHFDLLYIEQGLQQLRPNERIDLVPIILQDLSANFEESPRNAAVLFNMFLRLLLHYPLPSRGTKEDREFRSEWRLNENPKDPEFLAQWIGKLMLFVDSTTAKSSPGLSRDDAEFLKLYGKDATWHTASGGLSLVDTKVQAARFLWTAALTPSEKFIPALLAAGNTNSRLSDIGDEILKTNLPYVSLEDRELASKLYVLLLGEEQSAGRPAANPVLKGKILRLLSRSKEATSFSESVISLTRQELGVNTSMEAPEGVYNKGLEATKLRKEVFTFIIWTARMAPQQALEQIAPAVVGDLRSYIETQGWPIIHDDSSITAMQELISRQRGYECIGLLAQACPRQLLLDPSLELLRWLFRSLVGDVSSKETSLSIESTLAVIMQAFASTMNTDLEEPLTELLLHYMGSKVGEYDASETSVKRSPRYVTVRFANRCFPFDTLPARWIDLLALSEGSSERQEVIEEGSRGLDPYWFQILNPVDSVKRSTEDAQEYVRRQYRIPNPVQAIEYLLDKMKGPQLHHATIKAILFCRNLLFHSALSADKIAPAINQDWERSLEALATQDETGRRFIAKYLTESHADNGIALAHLCEAAFDGFLLDNFSKSTDAGRVLLDILSLGPRSILDSLSQRAPDLVSKIYSNNPKDRSTAGQLFALLASSSVMAEAAREQHATIFLQRLRAWRQAVGAVVHQTCGAALTLTYLFTEFSTTADLSQKFTETRGESIDILMEILFEARDHDLENAVLASLDQLCIHGILTEKTVPEKYDLAKLVQKLYELSKNGKEIAVLCLGHLAMQCSEDMSDSSTSKTIFDKLEALHEVRQPELHFAVGSALSCLAVGWSSRALTQYKDARTSHHQSIHHRDVLDNIISKVLHDCVQTKPALRQASAVWLLCLLQDCSDLPEIATHLKGIHHAFRNFLSDRSTLNQETASRGLALVYEKGDREMKDELIKDLVQSFTSNKSSLAGTVTEDTELFDAGALPTGDGSVTTYKDIMSLATEVGDPSLVYRFMSLASNSALWSSRAAFGRFGLSKVLAEASESGYLAQNPKLYSTLYRYRFDPNPSVRSSMNEIWTALVSNPSNVLDTYFDRILEDLLKNVLGKEWRTRQACCAAIADLIQTKPLSKYEKELTKIWNAAFKVCDDIKGSVRKAAMELVRALTGLLTRNLEGGKASSNDRILKQVIPFLSGPQGLESATSDIRLFALSALLDIIKKGSRTILQPYVGELVANHLMPSFTSIEPDVINYAYMKPDNFNLTTEQIDNSRLNSVKLSPMMDAIERCLDMLDESSMQDLVRHLSESGKTIIGVPSKIGFCRVLVTLSTKHNVLFRPYADQFLKSLRRQVLDRNEIVATSAAAACGYLARISSDSAVLEHIKYIKSLYLQSSEEKARYAAADLTIAVVKYATDRSQAFAAEISPFIFLAMHDTDKATAAEFKSAWEEMVGGSRTIRLYLQEISVLATDHLDSPQWAFKHASSLAIADAIMLLGAKISDTDAKALWPSLDKALAPKTWNGKEKVLQAFIHFVQNSELPKKESSIGNRCKEIAFREARRNNSGIYRQQAVKSLGQFIETVGNVDWFEQVSQIVTPMIETMVDDAQAMDIDDDSDSRTRQLIREETMGNALRTLLRSIDPTIRRAAALNDSLGQAIKVVQTLSKQHGVLVQNTALEAQRDLMQRIADAGQDGVSAGVLLDFLSTLDTGGEGVEASRLKSAEVVEIMAKMTGSQSEVRERLVGVVDSWMQVDRSRAVQDILQRTKRALGS